MATPDIEKATSLFRDVLGAKVSEKHVSMDQCINILILAYFKRNLNSSNEYTNKSIRKIDTLCMFD